jgi:hypothetical protein
MKFLKVHSVNEGFCRVNFTCQNKKNEKLFYCLQESKENGVKFLTFYRSSKDLEPSHPIDSTEFIFQYPNPILHGNTELINMVWEYIDNHNSKNTATMEES